MKSTFYIIAALAILSACKEKPKAPVVMGFIRPEIRDNGRVISFPDDSTTLAFFQTETLGMDTLSANYNAPAHVAATVVPSTENAGHNLVLFDDEDLTASYTGLIQHQIAINQISNVNIRQKQIDYDRLKDLSEHGAATGKDVLDAQTALAMEHTNLQNEKTGIIEQEAKLKEAGFDPQTLLNAKAGQVWVTCDVPESQLNKLKVGGTAIVHFSSFPDESFPGRIESFGDVVDDVTRMVKMRISLPNSQNRFKAGMFASVSFGMSEGKLLSIPQASIVTVQGKNYAFVQDSVNVFERREIVSGQQIGDRVVIFSGLQSGDKVVNKGAMQLKGLSFGY
ncbi:RND family efflux transporter, MFP subunit [Chitinophaga costaii]|uniref:RND family efflux transporter, MFP subunit n=1 Tax=Chitinophaga costaii TaxID=1335309 RepID=A0A1C4CQF3_9BACT|nr:efflux RND transporter periplasmic adaptor subunit [Chitinophaga costaii]SCC21291.1 RND family efflux transporter, MFP subunit [Chitinophaga costaii]